MWVGRYELVATSWSLWAGRCALVAVGRLLLVSYFGIVVFLLYCLRHLHRNGNDSRIYQPVTTNCECEEWVKLGT